MKTKCLLYCTTAKPILKSEKPILKRDTLNRYFMLIHHTLNGKIVAECEVECEEITYYGGVPYPYKLTDTALKKTCLTYEQLEDYLFPNNGYALHISNLKIFNKPLELKELEYLRKYKNCDCCPYGVDEEDMHLCGTCEELKPLTKAPQNMMWVWYKGQRYCCISIRPEWICKILNGEKDIEVRKKVLKEML